MVPKNQSSERLAHFKRGFRMIFKKVIIENIDEVDKYLVWKDEFDRHWRVEIDNHEIVWCKDFLSVLKVLEFYPNFDIMNSQPQRGHLSCQRDLAIMNLEEPNQ